MPGLYVGFDPAAFFFGLFIVAGIIYLIRKGAKRDS